MRNDCEPPFPNVDDPDVVSVDADVEAREREEVSGAAHIWMWVGPIAVVHLALIYHLARAALDVELPAYLHVDRIMVWLYLNGGAIGLGIWYWKKGRVPIAVGRWLQGRRARLAIVIWLGASLAWFLLPAVLNDAWDVLSGWRNGW